MFSNIKNDIFTKGDSFTLNSLKEVETLNGDKYILKLVEIRDTEFSLIYELQSGTFKGCLVPSSMVYGVKMTDLIDNRCFVEIACLFSHDVSEDFYERKKWMLKSELGDYIKLKTISEKHGCWKRGGKLQ